MKLLTNIITEYLKHNKRLVVPKLGTFIVKAQSGAILFSDLMRNDDGVLRSLLMAYGMKELEANGMIDRLVFEVRHATSRGNIFTIEGFGDFLQGPNNTITFRQKREKIVIGGNIKPPVETLGEEQKKIERVRIRQAEESATVQRKKPAQPIREVRKAKAKEEEDDLLNMTKPDSYLRGLKYDQKKKKKRDEDYMIPEQQRHGGRNLLFMLIAAIIVGVAVWFVWHYLDSNYTLTINSIAPAETETAELRDSTYIMEPRDTIISDSVTLVTNNSL